MKLSVCCFIAGLLVCVHSSSAVASSEPLAYRQQVFRVNGQSANIRIPEGYRLEVLTTDLDGPRMLTFAENGDLFIGSKSGNVYRLSHPYTKPQVLLKVGGYPHSIAFLPGRILIARTDGLYQAPYRSGQAEIESRQLELLAALPKGGGHSSRTVAAGPDGKIYMSLGISGNCKDQFLDSSYPFNRRRGGVAVLTESASAASWKPFASGLRNPVGFDWHPKTGQMFASNNGPDHHGFEQPPEYFSPLDEGSFHGMPWFQYDGAAIGPDDCIDVPSPRPLADVVKPVATFAARNAPMGVAFVPEGAMDARLEFDAVVALRGSWGTRPNGGSRGDPASRRPPGLAVVRFENGEALRVDELISGFQQNDGTRLLRPVGVAIGPDGALYFTSDDANHGLFRLRPIR